MILNVSGRTDIVAFYSKWFMNRYKEGFVDVRNPFYPTQVSRIYFEDVEAIVFCTKNPIPILEDLSKITIPILFQITLTPYKKEIEPNVPSKKEVIDAIKKISNMIGIERVMVRYDPVFLSDTYSLDYHIRAFDRLCTLLDGYVKTIIISFIDDYKNVRKNAHILNIKNFTEEDYREIGLSFSKGAKNHGMTVQTCFEERNLVEYGFIKGECVSHELIYRLTGKANFKTWKARKGKNCNCVEMVDIGAYNTCNHRCRYCYANYEEKQIEKNIQNHLPSSSLLIGRVEEEDNIKIRK